MNLHQTVEPTPHPTKVRAIAYELALNQTTSSNDQSTKTIIELAKEIEEYLWGKFAPIEVAATPLSTIEDTIDHLVTQLGELANNITERDHLFYNFDSLTGMAERLRADIHAVLSAIRG